MLCCSYLHFLRLGLLLNPELSDSTNWGSQLAIEIPVSDSRTLGLQLGCHICPAFYVDSGGWDSDFHVCVRQALYPLELSPQCSYDNSKMQMAFSSASHIFCFFWLLWDIMTMVSFLCLTETHRSWNVSKDRGWMCAHVTLPSVTLEHVFMNGINCHDGDRIHIN